MSLLPLLLKTAVSAIIIDTTNATAIGTAATAAIIFALWYYR